MNSVSLTRVSIASIVALMAVPTSAVGQWQPCTVAGNRPCAVTKVGGRDRAAGMLVTCMKEPGNPQVMLETTDTMARLERLHVDRLPVKAHYELDTPGGIYAPFPEDTDVRSLNAIDLVCHTGVACMADGDPAWEFIRPLLSGLHKKLSIELMGFAYAVPLNNASEELLKLSCVKERMGFKRPGGE